MNKVEGFKPRDMDRTNRCHKLLHDLSETSYSD